MEDFVGDGCLRELLPKLLEEGWGNVPTLKLMNSEDMGALNMTQQQKVWCMNFDFCSTVISAAISDWRPWRWRIL